MAPDRDFGRLAREGRVTRPGRVQAASVISPHTIASDSPTTTDGVLTVSGHNHLPADKYVIMTADMSAASFHRRRSGRLGRLNQSAWHTRGWSLRGVCRTIPTST
jgi:hypothetical protein